MHAVLTRHQSGQVGGTRRRADRIVAEGTVEADALLRHLVDVRGLDIGVAIAAHGPGAVVVGEDENDVGFLFGGGAVAEAQGKGKAGDEKGEFHGGTMSESGRACKWRGWGE